MIRGIRTPEILDPSGNSFLPLRVRAKPWIVTAALHISGDSLSYHVAADSIPSVVGVVLLQDLGTGDISCLVREVGSDASRLRVLPEPDWRAGQYLALIDNEWCLFRALRAEAPGAWTLDGLLRGRLGTAPSKHNKGTACFLADRRWLAPVRDHLLMRGSRIYMKTQPIASDVLPLTRCKAVSFTY